MVLQEEMNYQQIDQFKLGKFFERDRVGKTDEADYPGNSKLALNIVLKSAKYNN